MGSLTLEGFDDFADLGNLGGLGVLKASIEAASKQKDRNRQDE